MKQVTAIVLLLCLSLQLLSSVSVVTCYTFQKDLIAQYFCENKDRPELHCEGKCFVNKQLKKSEEERQRSAEQPEQAMVYHLVLPPQSLRLPAVLAVPLPAPVAYYAASCPDQCPSSPFLPPRG